MDRLLAYYDPGVVDLQGWFHFMAAHSDSGWSRTTYDDVFVGYPTPVDICSFAARGHDGHILVEWTTATELDNAGFNLYRGLSVKGPRIQLNEQLIAADGDQLKGMTYYYTDCDVIIGMTYYYWLEDVDLEGKSTMHGPVSVTPGSGGGRREPVPTVFSLAPNVPNPFAATTEIRYGLPNTCDVNLAIYNVEGKKVRSLVNRPEEAGYKLVQWDGRNEQGIEVASGIYFYRLEAGTFKDMKKMILLR